jgi:hypothetical protein
MITIAAVVLFAAVSFMGMQGPSAAECGCKGDPESIAEGVATMERMAKICQKSEADAKSCLATCTAAGMEVRKAFYVGCMAEWERKKPKPKGQAGPSAAECGCGKDPKSITEGLATMERMAKICTKKADAKSCLDTCAAAGMAMRKAYYVGCME